MDEQQARATARQYPAIDAHVTRLQTDEAGQRDALHRVFAMGDDENGQQYPPTRTPRRMILERGAHSNWAKNAWALENGRESGYD